MERFPLGDDAELRGLELPDAEPLFAVVERERTRIREWLPWVDATVSANETRAFIAKCLASEGNERSYGIWIEGSLEGSIGLSINQDRTAEVGFWIGASREGSGFVTRAAAALTTFAFDELDMIRVQLTASPENVRSCAVAERLGMTREGVLRRAGRIRDDRVLDLAMYSILPEEWRVRASDA